MRLFRTAVALHVGDTVPPKLRNCVRLPTRAAKCGPSRGALVLNDQDWLRHATYGVGDFIEYNASDSVGSSRRKTPAAGKKRICGGGVWYAVGVGAGYPEIRASSVSIDNVGRGKH